MKPKSDPTERVLMTTAAARFRFVVRFIGLDLDTFRRGDWFNLQDDLRDFFLPTHADLKPGGLHTMPTEHPQPEEYAEEDFRALQAETRDFLALVIATRGNLQAWTPKSVQVGLTNPHVPAVEGQPGRHVLSVQGATRDLFLLRVWRLLGELNTGALIRCPECDTIFLRKSNQTFCSKRCTNRVMQQRHRQRQDVETPTSADP